MGGEVPDILAAIKRAKDRIRFADIVRAESRRTVLCHPDDAGRIGWHVEQAGLDDVITVSASAFVPAGQMYVVDEQALDAAMRETLGRWRLR